MTINQHHYYDGKQILITGINGFIGSHLAKKYDDLGAHVFGMERKNSSHATKQLHYKTIIGSITDKAFICSTLSQYKFDVIINCAALSGQMTCEHNKKDAYETNFLGLKNIVDAVIQKSSTTKIVQMGSRLEYGKCTNLPVSESCQTNPIDYYGETKLLASTYLLKQAKKFNLNALALRISNVYGHTIINKRQNYNIINQYINRAQKHKSLVIYGSGSQIRDYLHIEDLLSCIITAIPLFDSGGDLYNIGYGQAISFKTMVETIAKKFPTKTVFMPWPKESKRIETGDYLTDLHKITSKTGWVPIYSPENGIGLEQKTSENNPTA